LTWPSKSNFSLRYIVDVRLSCDHDSRVMLGSRHAVPVTAGDLNFVVGGLIVVKCSSAGLRPPPAPTTNAAAVRHLTVTARVAVADTTTRDKVTCCSSELGVDDQIEDEVDGEVQQQEEVCESSGCLERAVGARRQVNERDDVGWSDEDCEENDQGDQCRSNAVSRVDRLLIASIQRLHTTTR